MKPLLLFLLAGMACAQTISAPDAPIKIGDVEVTGTLRSRLYVWNWFQAATGESQYTYSGNYLRLNLAEKLSAWDWDAEFTVPFLLGLPTTATDPAPQGALGLGANYFSANSSAQNTATTPASPMTITSESAQRSGMLRTLMPVMASA